MKVLIHQVFLMKMISALLPNILAWSWKLSLTQLTLPFMWHALPHATAPFYLPKCKMCFGSLKLSRHICLQTPKLQPQVNWLNQPINVVITLLETGVLMWCPHDMLTEHNLIPKKPSPQSPEPKPKPSILCSFSVRDDKLVERLGACNDKCWPNLQ